MRCCHTWPRVRKLKAGVWIKPNLFTCAIVILVSTATPMEMSIRMMVAWLEMFTILPANTHYCIVLASIYYHGAISKVCPDNILQHVHNIYGSGRYLDIYPSHPPIKVFTSHNRQHSLLSVTSTTAHFVWITKNL